MKVNLFSLITLRLFLFPLQCNGQPSTTVECPKLHSNRPVSSILCQRHDGSVVEVKGPDPITCKISYLAIRSQSIDFDTHEQQETEPNQKHDPCELWLIQFTDAGIVQRTCCKHVPEEYLNPQARLQRQQIPDIDTAQAPLEFHDVANEPIEHFLPDDQALRNYHETEREGHKVGYDHEFENEEDYHLHYEVGEEGDEVEKESEHGEGSSFGYDYGEEDWDYEDI